MIGSSIASAMWAKAGFAVALLIVATWGCSERHSNPSMVADAARDLGVMELGGRDSVSDHDESGSCDPANTGATIPDAAVSSPRDADPQLPAGLVAPAPPDVCCDLAAGGTICDLPPSGCASAGADGSVGVSGRTNWIVYYENPRCVSGRCVWDQSYFQCQGANVCMDGACGFVGTTLP